MPICAASGDTDDDGRCVPAPAIRRQRDGAAVDRYLARCRTGSARASRRNGSPSSRVTIDKLGDVGPALRAAAAAQAEGRTTILEMMVTRELGDPFRRDALSLPVRHLDKYRSTAAARG